MKKPKINNVVIEAVRKGVTSFWDTPLPKPTKLVITKATKITSAITGEKLKGKREAFDPISRPS